MEETLKVDEISDEELEAKGKEIVSHWDEGEEVNEVMEDTVEWTEEGQEFCGKYIRLKNGVGVHNSNIYVFREHGTGDEKGIWGSTVLDGKMANAKLHEDYKIVYMGIKTSVKKAEYKDFKVITLVPRQ